VIEARTFLAQNATEKDNLLVFDTMPTLGLKRSTPLSGLHIVAGECDNNPFHNVSLNSVDKGRKSL
jgi:hypothetical protein